MRYLRIISLKNFVYFWIKQLDCLTLFWNSAMVAKVYVHWRHCQYGRYPRTCPGLSGVSAIVSTAVMSIEGRIDYMTGIFQNDSWNRKIKNEVDAHAVCMVHWLYIHVHCTLYTDCCILDTQKNKICMLFLLMFSSTVETIITSITFKIRTGKLMLIIKIIFKLLHSLKLPDNFRLYYIDRLF